MVLGFKVVISFQNFFYFLAITFFRSIFPFRDLRTLFLAEKVEYLKHGKYVKVYFCL